MNRFEMKDPEQAVFSMTVEMRLCDWREVRELLAARREYAGGAIKIENLIDSMVRQAEKVYWPEST